MKNCFRISGDLNFIFLAGRASISLRYSNRLLKICVRWKTISLYFCVLSIDYHIWISHLFFDKSAKDLLSIQYFRKNLMDSSLRFEILYPTQQPEERFPTCATEAFFSSLMIPKYRFLNLSWEESRDPCRASTAKLTVASGVLNSESKYYLIKSFLISEGLLTNDDFDRIDENKR